MTASVSNGSWPDDARQRGWDREVDRHERVAERLRGLLTELGEPCDTPDDEEP